MISGSGADEAGDAESAAQAEWRTLMSRIATPGEGCFHASYPDFVWNRVACEVTHEPRVDPARDPATDASGAVTGNGHDYVANATGLIIQAEGAFSTKGVKSEKGVGVSSFGGGGILGPNEYSLQINTNSHDTTSACAGHSGCTAWQQFVYSPDYNVKGQAAVLIQYW